MNKISRSTCKPRKQTNRCIVSMFWPKQMYDRNISPNPRKIKSKGQIVLSTCVGYRQKTKTKKTPTTTTWRNPKAKPRLIAVGATQPLTTWIPQSASFSGCLLVKQRKLSIHHCSTILPLHEHCGATKSIVQVYCLSHGLYHTNTDPAENRRSFVCTIQSVIISGFHLACYFASEETEQLD